MPIDHVGTMRKKGNCGAGSWWYLLLLQGLANGLHVTPPTPPCLGRRNVFRKLGGMVSSSVILGQWPDMSLASVGDVSKNLDFAVYQVSPDASATLDPSLISLTAEDFLKRINACQSGALWLGEHHNSARDHSIQVELLKQLSQQMQRKQAPLAVGLEQVQVQFQPVLDNFIAGKISLAEMRRGVEWDSRWVWPFEVYEPIFTVAQERNIPLIALNVNSEDLALVEKGGLMNLPPERLRQYIVDGPGFDEFIRRGQFSTYVDYVIRPSYNLHQEMGLLKYTMSGEKLDEPMPFRNFLSSRVLWDEAMATRAYLWNQQNAGGLLVGLVGADHVKFRNGIPGRYTRLTAGQDKNECISVILNPTLIDTQPPGSVLSLSGAPSSVDPEQLCLQLRYLKDGVEYSPQSARLPESTGGVMPLANFLLIG